MLSRGVNSPLWVFVCLLGVVYSAQAQWSTPQGPYHSPLNSLAADPNDAAVVYATSGEGGIVVSTDAGASWSRIGPTNLVFKQVAVDPFDSQSLFAISGGILFKSSDGGATWSRSGSSYSQAYLVKFDPRSAGVAYMVVDRAVVKTVDGGATWIEAIRVPAPDTTSTLAIDPTSPNVLYLGGFGTAVRRSGDGGATWVPAQTGLEGQSIYDIEVSPHDSQRVFAATFTGVFRSSDGGASWERTGLASGQVTDLVLDSSQPDRILAAHRDRGITQSVNGGAGWTSLNAGLEELQIVGLQAVSGQPYEWLAATNRNGFFTLGPGEAQWTNISHLPEPATVTAMNWSPDGTVLFAGTDRQGVFSSSDNGETWQIASSLLDGQAVVQIVAPESASGGAIYVAAQSRLFRSDTSGRSWRELKVKLGAGVTIHGVHLHPQIPNTLFLATSAGVYRSFNGGSTWADANLAEESVVSVSLDPVRPDVLYATTASGLVYKSTDRGARWEDISAALGAVPLQVEADPKIGERVYVVLTDGTVALSEDGGASWRQVGNGFSSGGPDEFFTTPDGALFLISGAELYRSLDGGASWLPTGVGAAAGTNVVAAAARSGGKAAVAVAGVGVSVAELETGGVSPGPGAPGAPGDGSDSGGGGGAFWVSLLLLLCGAIVRGSRAVKA